MSLTEKEIINQAKLNPNRFAPLYDKYYRQIFLFVFKKVADEDLAGDLTSQTFLKAILNIKKYEHKGFPFSSWLYRIASNEVNMHFRKANKHQMFEVNERDVVVLMKEIDEGEEKLKQIQKLLDLVGSLPVDQSEIIELRFFQKYSFAEIGEMLGISSGNAKIKTYRVLKKLKKDLA